MSIVCEATFHYLADVNVLTLAANFATHRVAAHVGVRTDRYKLMHFHEPEYDSWELYDLESDPLELNSVADDPAYADIRADLQLRLRELQAQYGETAD